jgi:zinc transport system permease protein
LFVGYYYHDLVSLSYDEEFAQVRGVPVRFLYFSLIAMIALLVVMIIQVVGLILVIALLTIPPYMAEKYAGSLSRMMLYAVLLNLFFTTAGLWFSYHFNLTSGASIIMVAAVCFFISLLVEYLKPKFGIRN